jgi:hypothetical protein
MSMIIDLPSGAEWQCANWIYRNIVDDFARLFPQHEDLIAELRYHELYYYLDFRRLDVALAHRLYDALRAALHSIEREGASVDLDDDQTIYYRAIQEFSELMKPTFLPTDTQGRPGAGG